MLDLNRYLRNPFATPEISRDEILAFTADFLGKWVTQNPGGKFDAEIAATTSLFEALEGTIGSEATASALRQARTAATTAKREAIHEALSRIEGLVHARFPRGSATYVELLPGGLDEFRKSTLDALNARLTSLVERLQTHAAVIGAADVAALATLQGEWATIRGEQVGKKGTTTDAAGDRRSAMEALRAQLFDDLLAIARHEKSRPENLTLYMTQSLLEEDRKNEEQAPVLQT